MFTEENYAYYAEIIDDWLSLCQYRAANRRFFRLPFRQRPYKVYVEDNIPELGIKSQINAFSYYDTQVDRIFIMRRLIDFFADVLNDVSETQEQYSWMFHVALWFCGFHEFGHLYLGHCQMNESRRMAMTFSDNINAGFTPKDIQAMEFEADMYAADQLADLVRQQIKSKEYIRTWNYSDFEKFYSDAIKGICGFFSIIKYLEYKEQKKKSLGKQKEYDHPSFLLREYVVGSVFLAWMEKFGFGRKDEELRHYMVHNDEIFMKAPYDAERVEYEYGAILDGSIREHARHVIDYCNRVLDKKTAPYTRLKASGSMVIKFR